ncbi:MAG TPA: PQQ-dependent sugar dehydrogenase [Labilithrix sp.]
MAHRPLLALVVASIVAAAAALGACGDDSSGDNAQTDDGGPDGPTGDGAPPPPMRSEFGLDSRPTNATCKPPARPPNASPLAFQQVYGNLTLNTPMVMDHIPGDSSRWFVAERGGTIVSFPSANPMQTDVTTVADVAALAGNAINVETSGEGGLLGMAFHPSFATNGRLYISWTGNDTGSCAAPLGNYGGCSMRSRVGYLTYDTGMQKFTKYDELFVFDQTNATNHKGGCARFGTDGFLYLTFGDGGSGDDPFTGDNVVHNGQSTHRFFSKMLRIDVDNPAGGKPYGIPAGNPFADGMAGSPEVFAYGFRNPFRFSIDRATGDVWQGDVGQNQYEEVDVVKAGGNYGWSCREATHDYFATDMARCPNGTAGLTDPILEQQHVPNNSRAIIGGRVYRGKAIPSFVGGYVWGDEVQTKLFSMTIDTSTLKPVFGEIPGAPTASWVDFAEDVDGEVYAVALNNQIWKMIAGNNGEVGPDTFPDKLSKTGCVDPANPRNPASGLVPYTVNAALWSDGADKRRWMALPDGATIAVQGDGDFDFPIGTVMMKEFSLGGKRIETRLLMRHDDGGWAGYTYEWLDDESDAQLLPSSKVKTVGSQPWYYPSRSDCTRCHSEAADHTLGPELGQLNGDYVYTDTNRISNQLHTLEHIGMFSAPLGKPVDQIVAYPDPFGTAPVDQRARAYLHSNCSQCHRPMGNGGGDIDFRFATAFADVKVCNVDPQRGDLGLTGAKLLVPGSPATSLVSVRPHELPGANRMPPLATSLVDTKGTSVIDDWIRGVTACP